MFDSKEEPSFLDKLKWDLGLHRILQITYMLHDYDWGEFATLIGKMKTPLAYQDDQIELKNFVKALDDLKKFTSYFADRGRKIGEEIDHASKN